MSESPIHKYFFIFEHKLRYFFKFWHGREEIVKWNHILVFFSYKKYFHRFIKWRLKNWTTWLPFRALEVVVPLLSVQGQKALRFHQKYLNLCSKNEWRSYRFRMTWGRVIPEFLFFGDTFLVIYPFNCKNGSEKSRRFWALASFV